MNDSIKKFKTLLDDQFKTAKDYKPKIEWFEGTWSRYKPEKGKDKRGVTGADTKKLLEISNKINSIPKEMILSTNKKKIEEINTKIKTIMVVVITSGFVGHVIFKASCLTSL